MARVQAKNVLNPSRIFDYCLNPYTGCQMSCRYCYAGLFMRRYSGHSEPWGSFVDIKINAVERLRAQLAKAKRGTVWISSVCDPYQPLEKESCLTRRCLEELLEKQFPIQVQTKSALCLRDLDLFAQFREITVCLTLATDDQDMAALFEPGASPLGERLQALSELRARGIRTHVFAGPLLPGDPLRLAGLIAERADHVLIDRMNYADSIRRFYQENGLAEFLTPGFFRRQAAALGSELRRKGVSCEILF